MSSWKGESLHLSVYGHSHGPSIGMTMTGVPAGYAVNMEKLQAFLKRRAPGNDPLSTARKEPDIPHFQSGLVNGETTGSTISAEIYNTNVKSSDYADLANCPRPGHADYTAKVKYGMDYDTAGGGHFSGRLTAPICVAGGMCLQWLNEMGIYITGHISSIGGIEDVPYSLDATNPKTELVNPDFPVADSKRREQMREQIRIAKADGDSIGGVIECVVTGLPAGIGGPLFDGLEGKLSQALFGIPAIKGVEFGAGFHAANLRGSENNDAYTILDGKVQTLSNHAGGILGGITTGMPLTFRLAIKPTPSIAKPQQTVNMRTMQNTQITINGRHDPCIVPRAVPVVEAVTALVLFDALLSKKQVTGLDLKILRRNIDQIDDKLIPLFLERLEIARQIGQYKKENDLPIYDPKREKDKLRDIAEKAGEDFSDYIKSLYTTIFEISKDYQNRNNSID